MLNQIVLVGRLVQDPQIKELEENKKMGNITLAVSRNFKNKNGEYETDFIDIIMYDNLAKNTKEYCKKGDVVGVKGRIQTRTIDNIKYTDIVADRVTFLSYRKDIEDNGE